MSRVKKGSEAPIYDYVKRAYGVNPVVGARVTHTEFRPPKPGVIAPENPSSGHYVMVKFDGERHASPCHPTSLDYGAGQGGTVAKTPPEGPAGPPPIHTPEGAPSRTPEAGRPMRIR